MIHYFLLAPPKLTNVSNGKPNHSVNEGSNLQLFCEASGLPPPNITWTKVLQGGSESEVLHKGASWNFASITSSSTGIYRCKATNGIGSSASQLIGVIVSCMYTINIHFTNFGSLPTDEGC